MTRQAEQVSLEKREEPVTSLNETNDDVVLARRPVVNGSIAIQGLALFELVVALAIVAALAVAAQPLAVNAGKRAKDAQLKRALRDVRAAIDTFNLDWRPNEGLLCQKALTVCRKIGSQDGYPRQLDTLLKVEYVDTTLKPPPPPTPSEEGGEAGKKPEVKTERRVYLRKALMTDPITGTAWQLRCYDDPPDAETWCGKDIYDVRTSSNLKGLDGTPYNTW